MYKKRKLVNLIPLSEEDVNLASQKRLKLLRQSSMIKEFVHYIIFLIILYIIVFNNTNMHSNQFKKSLDKLFSIDYFKTSVKRLLFKF